MHKRKEAIAIVPFVPFLSLQRAALIDLFVNFTLFMVKRGVTKDFQKVRVEFLKSFFAILFFFFFKLDLIRMMDEQKIRMFVYIAKTCTYFEYVSCIKGPIRISWRPVRIMRLKACAFLERACTCHAFKACAYLLKTCTYHAFKGLYVSREGFCVSYV